MTLRIVGALCLCGIFPGIRGAALAGEPEGVTLAQAGKTRWRLFVPPEANTVERFAAAEFERYFTRVTGASLAPARAASRDYVIQIGLRERLTNTAGFLPAPKKGFDGYTLVIAPRRIVVSGDAPRGVLYGVYDLLERLGCRWHVPGLDARDPEVVPSRPQLTLAAGAWAEASPLELRIYNGSAFFFDLRGERMLPQIAWAARNRYNGISWQTHHKPGSLETELRQMRDTGALAALDQRGLFLHGPCHSFPHFLPTEKYFSAHPDWFGYRAGKRHPHGGEWPAVNYCWSNPEANAALAGNVETFLRELPQLKVLCLVWIDGGVVCECEPCRRRGGANLIVDLFNYLSDRLATNFPGVRLESVVGYAPIEKPPTEARPNGKWQAVYAHWGRHHEQSYGDRNYSRRTQLELWHNLFPRFEVCSYYAAASHQPFNGPPFFHALRADTDYLVRQGVTGAYVLQYPHGFWWNYAFNLSAAGLYSYYYPNRPPRAELPDFVESYFGAEAAPALLEFFQLQDRNLDASYRASRGEAKESEMALLRRMDALVQKALPTEDPTAAYRMGKLAAAHRVLMRWADGLRWREQARTAFAAWKQDQAPRESVDKAIAAARGYAKELLEYAARMEKDFPGTIEAGWLESWYVQRTLLAPLQELEKELSGEEVKPRNAGSPH